MSLKTLPLCLLFVLFYNSSRAIYFTQYTSLHSLISNNVYNAFLDSKGYMWFATDRGVSRFDGKEFKNYTALDGLGDNEIFGFYEDQASRLWLFTYNGNHCYLRNDSVFNANNDSWLKNMPVTPFVTAMYTIDDTTLYIGYRFGDLVKISGTTITYLSKSNLKSPDHITSIYKQGELFYAVGQEEVHIIDKDRIVRSVQLNSKVRSNYCNGTLLLADDKGVKVYRSDTLVYKFDDKNLVFDNVINIMNDNSRNVFVSTLNGLYILNCNTGKKDVLFEGQRVSNVSQDMYGNYWVASFGEGIFCINKELDKLKFHRKIQNATLYQTACSQLFMCKNDTLYIIGNKPLSEKILHCRFSKKNIPMYADDSLLFFSSQDGTHIYNLKNGKEQKLTVSIKWVFPNKNSYLCILHYSGISYKLKISNARGVFFDSSDINKRIKNAVLNRFDNKIYIVSDNALYRYDEVLNRYDAIDIALEEKSVINTFCVRNNIILLTNQSKHLSYDIASNYKRTTFSTADFAIFGIADIGNNVCLIRTNKGYYTFHLKHQFLPDSSMKKVEYPFKSNQLFNVYVINDELLCNVNGDLYSISTKLVNKELEKPVFYIKKMMANGVPVYTNNIVLNKVKRCHLNLVLITLYFNNTDNIYQYRIYDERETGQWYHSNGNNLNIMIPEPGSYKIEIRMITENNVVSASKFITVTLSPPFYYLALFWSLIAILVILSVIYAVYLYNKWRRQIFQNKLNYLKLEHRAASALLNPHFTFNAISNIQNLVNEHAPEKANDYLAVLSKLIRQNMENLQFNLIPIDNELNLVANYIYLQNLRFDSKIKLAISNNLPNTLEVNIPPLLIHTFVENAVVHGFSKEIKNFTVHIDITLSVNDYLIISIRDNGLGIKATKKNYSHLHEKTALGIGITEKRLERLSRFHNVDHSIDISAIDEEDATGTEVRIILYSKFTEPVI